MQQKVVKMTLERMTLRQMTAMQKHLALATPAVMLTRMWKTKCTLSSIQNPGAVSKLEAASSSPQHHLSAKEHAQMQVPMPNPTARTVLIPLIMYLSAAETRVHTALQLSRTTVLHMANTQMLAYWAGVRAMKARMQLSRSEVQLMLCCPCSPCQVPIHRQGCSVSCCATAASAATWGCHATAASAPMCACHITAASAAKCKRYTTAASAAKWCHAVKT